MKRLPYILSILLCICIRAGAQEVAHDHEHEEAADAVATIQEQHKASGPFAYSDSALYQGMHFKLDLGNTLYTIGRSRAGIQSYEMLINVNLQKRFYPTVEFGYALATDSAQSGMHTGQGGFMRVGLDLNPLKKNRNNRYALLVGVRLGWDVQRYQLSGVHTGDTYWRPDYTWTSAPTWRGDCWGEIVAGTQIWVGGPVFMGWAVRMKFLFTRKTGQYQPYYVPGYGTWGESQFSFNYYVGVKI